MNANDYAAVMIEAQRAAFNALRSTTPMFNTVGAGGIMFTNADANREFAEKQDQFMKINVEAQNRYDERVNKNIPLDLRLTLTYTPLIIRELISWLSQESIRLLKESGIKDAADPGRRFSCVLYDYNQQWIRDSRPEFHEKVVWLMKDWISSSFGKHVETLKNSYLFVVSNGEGPKYRDANTRDLIAWMYTTYALSEEIGIFCSKLESRINKKIHEIDPDRFLESNKDYYTGALSQYAKDMLHKFGFDLTCRSNNISLARKVIRNKMEEYKPNPRIKEYDRLQHIEDIIKTKKTIKLQ